MAPVPTAAIDARQHPTAGAAKHGTGQAEASATDAQTSPAPSGARHAAARVAVEPRIPPGDGRDGTLEVMARSLPTPAGVVVDDTPGLGQGDAGTGSAEAAAREPQAAMADPEVRQELDWVERARAGDSVAFGLLYRKHVRAVHLYAIAPLVREAAIREELLAETFVRARLHIHRFEPQGRGLLPWLIRIGKNLALDHLRKAGRVVALAEGAEQRIPDARGHGDVEAALARRQSANRAIERVAAVCAHLNPRYRRVIELRMLEGASRETAAAELGVSLGTLDVVLCRACKAFRKIYEAEYGADGSDTEAMGT